MRRRSLVLVIYASLLTTAALAVTLDPSTACRHDASSFRCVQFLKNYDGDTITVDIPDLHPLFGKGITVRVQGVDTPEMTSTQPCERAKAILARDFVHKLMAGAKNITLSHVGRDKYFRILADVSADGVDLKTELLKNGLAYEYDGGTKRPIPCK